MPCLWSKGIAHYCDVRGTEDYWLAPTESLADAAEFRAHHAYAGGLVWMRLGTRSRPPLSTQPLKVFTDIDLNLNSPDRMEAVQLLADCGHVELQRRRVSQHAVWKRYASSPFVLNLAGNGLDCYRTWEGSISARSW
ncbi:hypothetical protein RHIZO_04719 [Rhizobiaceae bacterium]|nr:hypothetical protein RHIZO_04719 [Rhizobiaceae bacterium]